MVHINAVSNCIDINKFVDQLTKLTPPETNVLRQTHLSSLSVWMSFITSFSLLHFLIYSLITSLTHLSFVFPLSTNLALSSHHHHYTFFVGEYEVTISTPLLSVCHLPAFNLCFATPY